VRFAEMMTCLVTPAIGEPDYFFTGLLDEYHRN